MMDFELQERLTTWQVRALSKRTLEKSLDSREVQNTLKRKYKS